MTNPGLSAIINHNKANLDEIHSYALAELNKLAELIERVKLNIEQAKNHAATEVQVYVETIERAVGNARTIESSVLAIEASVPGKVERREG